MWPHILKQEMPNAKLLNFGSAGAGNLQISCTVSQAHKHLRFCDTDLVIVMWSSFVREDRFFHGKWQSHGNVFNNHFYDLDFCKKYVDVVGFLKRDCELISLTNTMLHSLPCTTLILKSHPFLTNEVIRDESELSDMDEYKLMPYIKETYSEMFNSMPQSLCEVVFNNYPNVCSEDWLKAGHTYLKKDGSTFTDAHPRPTLSCKYLQYIGFDISQRTIQYAEEVTDLLCECSHEDKIREIFNYIYDTNLEFYNIFTKKQYATVP
jgi:hypothetical protein